MAAAPVVAAIAPTAPEAIAPEAKRDSAAHGAATHTGWIVQVGAFDVERDAQQRLSAAHAKIGHVLDNADPFTEPVVKGDKTLYRARFAGFQRKQLKCNDIDCIYDYQELTADVRTRRHRGEQQEQIGRVTEEATPRVVRAGVIDGVEATHPSPH